MPREKLKPIKMDESENNMSTEDIRMEKNPKSVKVKPKKRSLVERELETSLTAHFTSPVPGEGMSTSRYGRARKLKTDSEFCDTEKVISKALKSPEVLLSTPIKFSPVAYKMHASNSSMHNESPKRNVSLENSLENQIENIYNANISLSRFGSEEKKSMTPSPAKKFYIRKDLIQSKEKEKQETVTLIKNMFSPPKSTQKNSHLNNILERSSEKFCLRGSSSSKSQKPQNGYIDNSSVVKTLDFGGSKKKKKSSTETKPTFSKNQLFEVEAKSPYVVGDLAWARMGTYPFWPCMVTREPGSEMFIRKKLFGKVERDMIHVTFFADNGRRSWILDSMLRKYQGLPEFEAARDAFTPEKKKKDQRLYNAFFVSDKKLSLWYTAVEEADMLQREPKRFRIEILNQLLGNPNITATPIVQKKSGKITRTDSDVSLSESLYDSLFSGNDVKNDDADRSRHKSRNKSLDVSEVVTACLDNMAAKTGITMIQKQSHMDIWLQKAKSKTPEKSQFNITVSVEKLDNENPDAKVTGSSFVKENESSVLKKEGSSNKKKRSFTREVPIKKPYSFRKSTTESQNLFSHYNDHDYSKNVETSESTRQADDNIIEMDHQICVIDKVVSLCEAVNENNRHGSPTFTQNYDIDISATTENFSTDKSANLDFENTAPESPTFTQRFDDVDTGFHEQTTNKNDEIISITENTNELTTNVIVVDQPNDAAKHGEIADVFLDEIHLKSTNKIEIPVVASEKTMCSEDDIFKEQSTNNDNKNISSLKTTNQLENDFNMDNSDCMDEEENQIATDAEPMDIEKDVQSVDAVKDTENADVAKDADAMDVLKDIESLEVTKDAESIEVAKEAESTADIVRDAKSVDKPEDGESTNDPKNAASLFMAKDAEPTCVPSNETNFQSTDQNKILVTDNHFLSKIPACSEGVSESNTGGNTKKNLEQIENVIVIKILDNKNVTNSDKTDAKKTDTENNVRNIDISVQNEEKIFDQLPKVVVEKVAVLEVIPQKAGENVEEKEGPEETVSNGGLNRDVDRISDDLFAEDNFDDNEDISLLDEENLLKDPEDEVEDTTTMQNYTENIKKGSHSNKTFFSTKKNTDSRPMVNGYAEKEHTKSKSTDKPANDEIAVDNISLKSVYVKEITFEPDTISINSLSSEVSDTCEILPQTKEVISLFDNTCSTDDETPVNTYNNLKHKRKVLIIRDSDTESVSSLEDVALSELLKRTKAKTVSKSTEGSTESTKSDYIQTNKKLRLVLTDCLLTKENKKLAIKKNVSSTNIECISTKESKLPTVRKVDSNTNIEIEISGAENRFESDLDIPLKLRKLRRRKTKEPSEPIEETSEPTEETSEPTDDPSEPVKVNGFHESKETTPEKPVKVIEIDTISVNSSDSGASYRRRGKKEKTDSEKMQDPEFLKYVELRQDALMDENPQLSNEEIMAYLYKTWEYEENRKSDLKKNDDIEQLNLVKGTSTNTEPPKKKKTRKKVIDIGKVIKEPLKAAKDLIIIDDEEDIKPRELPKRKASKPFYKEEYSDIEEELELFEIFKPKKKDCVKAEPQMDTKMDNNKITNKDQDVKVKIESPKKENIPPDTKEVIDISDQEYDDYYDEEEAYFEQLTKPKPNVFKGLTREKVCEICEKTANLVKCKGCSGMFHVECVNKVEEIIEIPAPTRGRKKKKKPRGRRPKVSTESNEESQSDEKCQDANVSEENVSFEDTKEPEPIVIEDADTFEAQLEEKMKEMIQIDLSEYYSYSSDMEISWSNSVAGKCEIVNLDVKPKIEPVVDLNFMCKNCQKHDVPICFVCKSDISPKGKIEKRQKCQVPHCHKYYHLECLDHWPQTQFNSGEPSRNNKKIDEHFEAITCPRHVCHTCVCDDPRGCKTRFSGDKLARCVRCPATYHSFTKCLPAGSQILSASHIVCPRHYEHRPGKVPCHVNTGWCFICALGGTLICCEYCPTSFHADCLNIQPPEGGYMCEDCETGRLPLYGEMVWVKLGHYRWWPGIVLHPYEIPDNIMAVKHSPGEFVVRFFGQYDHYWVNRGRVFPFQEGDSGRLSGQKSKIDEAFTKAMEHAQRAFEILKNVEANDEENQDIASSLLPPHYVKLKVNKPCGSLYGKKIDIEESSLTQCECNPDEEEPCGPYSHCLNRMLLTECGPTCRAGDRCQNRAFEKRLYPKLVPYRTPHRGWGLKTLEDIKAGQFVIEYVGELIDEEEFRRRMRRKHEMRDENFYFLTLDKERMIDAGPKGNLARFMNHCCEPNCETQKWTVLGDVRVGLFAINDIPANLKYPRLVRDCNPEQGAKSFEVPIIREMHLTIITAGSCNTEVTFNYNLECAGIEKKQCMCGAKRCSGYIGAKPKQDDTQSKKPKVPIKRTYKKRKNTESPSSGQNKPKRPVGRPPKPRELTEIEKDLLIIKNATNGLSSDSEGSGRLSSIDSERKDAKALKRKRVSFSTEEKIFLYNGTSSPSAKRMKIDEINEVGD